MKGSLRQPLTALSDTNALGDVIANWGVSSAGRWRLQPRVHRQGLAR